MSVTHIRNACHISPVSTSLFVSLSPPHILMLPNPMNYAKIFKSPLRQSALWQLVPNWYKSFPPDHFGQAEINDSTMLSNNTSTAWEHHIFGASHLPHCNTLQHTATHCNTLKHTATHCNTLQHTATHWNTLQHTATHWLQHTDCNTLISIFVLNDLCNVWSDLSTQSDLCNVYLCNVYLCNVYLCNVYTEWFV